MKREESPRGSIDFNIDNGRRPEMDLLHHVLTPRHSRRVEMLGRGE